MRRGRSSVMPLRGGRKGSVVRRDSIVARLLSDLLGVGQRLVGWLLRMLRWAMSLLGGLMMML